MIEPRAQRHVAPTDSPPFRAHRAAHRGEGSAPHDPFIVFAHAILAARGRDAGSASEPEPERTPTPDEIHQLRVAARRLRVALRLFGRMLPSRDVARFRTDLRWFASSLGDVRDLDVYAESFKAYRVERCRPSSARLERLRAVPAPRARGSAPAGGRVVREPAHDGAVRRHRSDSPPRGPSAGALRRWRSLTVRDGVRHQRSAQRRPRSPARQPPRLRARGPRELHEPSHQSQTLALRARILRRSLSRAQATGEDLQNAPRTAGRTSRRVHRHRSSAPLRQPAEEARRPRERPPHCARAAAPQPARARARRAPFFQREQWPAFVATHRRRAARSLPDRPLPLAT